MLPEFNNLFDPTDPTFIGTVSKNYADEALDLFLNSEVDNAMTNDLETYQGGCNKDDQTSGVHVLRYLQHRFAPVDDIDEQGEARRNLEALARSDDERMTHFNARFNAQVQYVRSCGIPILPRDQLSQYLRTLRSCEAWDIYYQVRWYTKRIASGESFTLTDVQEGLQQCDNEAPRDKRSQETLTGRH